MIPVVQAERAKGLMVRQIAEKHGVPFGFVKRHTRHRDHKYVRRIRKDARTVMVGCAGCGDEVEVTMDTMRKRERLKMGPFRCRPCVDRARRKPERIHPAAPEDSSWLTEEEQEKPRAWARRVLLSMSEKERRVFAELELPDDDHSSYARPPKRNRDRESFKPYPYAKLEKPFGSDLKREAA